jgi:hypothetical protein
MQENDFYQKDFGSFWIKVKDIIQDTGNGSNKIEYVNGFTVNYQSKSTESCDLKMKIYYLQLW